MWKKLMLGNLKIAGRLWIGFATIVSIPIGAVGVSIQEVNQIARGTDRIVTLRMPAADNST